MIKVYKKGSEEKISESYKAKDFDCHCHRKECDKTLIDQRMVEGLEDLPWPVSINSGYRCAEHNKQVGGSPVSKHLLGKAADVESKLATPKELRFAAEKIPVFENGGIGYYSTFVHLDSRNGKARW